MNAFPRTVVGGVSMPRMIIGTNWFAGFSHTSLAKDNFIREYQTPERLAAVLQVFVAAGVDAIMGGSLKHPVREAVEIAEQRTGKEIIRLITPSFNISPGGPEELEPERVFDDCMRQGAIFCMPHQCVTDALVDRRDQVIRDLDKYTAMIRERGMIPGLSTHMPETPGYADGQNADVETYIQIYNAAGFMMQVEIDWVAQVIARARKPVMTIKPFAAGRLLPFVGLAFVWNTIRDQDMVTVGVTTPDEAREVIDISTDLLGKRLPDNPLQTTRSKKSLK